jgi:hypothetical protein
MAELEVIKHTKKIKSIFHSDNPLVEKLIEFLVEIVIIVFAVSITIWFHDLAEHRHQQKEVKEFLVGLKQDLKSDLAEMQSDQGGYQKQLAALRFFSSMETNNPDITDSLKKYSDQIFNKVELVQNNGRFEGFKSSGKIGNIENKKLQNDILDLYQELIPSLLGTTQLYNEKKDRLIIFIEQNGHLDPRQNTLMMISEVMKQDQARIISSTLIIFPREILKRYDVCISRINEIVKTIYEEYGE